MYTASHRGKFEELYFVTVDGEFGAEIIDCAVYAKVEIKKDEDGNEFWIATLDHIENHSEDEVPQKVIDYALHVIEIDDPGVQS